MSSFLPEGGCYELLTVTGNVRGRHYLHAAGDCRGGLSVSRETWARYCQLVSKIHGNKTGFCGSSLVFFQEWEKRSCYQEKLFLQFFLFSCTLLMTWAVEWLAKKEPIGEKSRSVSCESNGCLEFYF